MCASGINDSRYMPVEGPILILGKKLMIRSLILLFLVFNPIPISIIKMSTFLLPVLICSKVSD